jgi:hypothetical protein
MFGTAKRAWRRAKVKKYAAVKYLDVKSFPTKVWLATD